MKVKVFPYWKKRKCEEECDELPLQYPPCDFEEEEEEEIKQQPVCKKLETCEKQIVLCKRGKEGCRGKTSFRNGTRISKVKSQGTEFCDKLRISGRG